ncbi:MAG: hypothetical protein KKF27_21660 [Gammaproteobacteria bacterium]|nr:hypothetical protein [Gammaproteobacteria bacterium]
MREFSFFPKLRGGSGEIRGIQMAGALGGKVDPASGYENDRCIYILGRIPEKEPEFSYHDVMDCGLAILSRVEEQTRGSLIAVGREHESYLRERFPNRKVFCLPQHHCNFDNEMRPERPVLTVGTIGGDASIQWPHYAMERMLREIGAEWRYGNECNRRRKVCAFYRNLDIQILWRPTHRRGLIRHVGPLKLINAGSFGIPTVAYPEPSYTAEWKKECLWAETMEHLIHLVKKLKDTPAFYAERAGVALEKAKEYHISRVAENYKALPC